jgi:hypothetical protein
LNLKHTPEKFSKSFYSDFGVFQAAGSENSTTDLVRVAAGMPTCSSTIKDLRLASLNSKNGHLNKVAIFF